jgi:hypothetical protein
MLAATEVVPVVPVPPGRTDATVASFTVTYGGTDPLEATRVAVVADLVDGARTAATCEDAGVARIALDEGLIGRSVRIEDTTFHL